MLQLVNVVDAQELFPVQILQSRIEIHAIFQDVGPSPTTRTHRHC